MTGIATHVTAPPAGDEDIVFAAETEASLPPGATPADHGDGVPWLILVVDDEPDIHSMTALILADVRYRNRPIRLLNAYSTAEAQQLLEHYPQIAVGLIDVVMEDEHAGLHLIRVIRNELRNTDIRLILRTGQPGRAPQRQVVIDYDINDYRSKAELSADDLFITVVAALRSYEHIVSIESRVAERTRELLIGRERLRTILESSPVGVGAIDDNRRLIFANLRFAELFGLTQAALLGTDLLTLLAEPADRQRYGDMLARELPIRDGEILLQRPDGATFWALLSGDPRTLEGQTGYLCWLHDISPLKRTEAALNAAKNQAEQATRAKSTFLATMSHEIRTPMNGVLGMLELLERSQLDLEQGATLTTIRESATALLRIIDDILDFSKIEAEKLVLEAVPVSLGAIVEGVAETLAPSAWRKELELLTFVQPEIPPVLIGDPLRLRQILFNFGGNAIKFTEHGRVILQVDLIALENTPPVRRARVRMQVSDTGIGIPEGAQANLFQPYAQAEHSTARRFGGTGLGLSICRRLAEMMGGEISVASTFRRGSTFSLDVALEVAEDGPSPHRNSAPLLAGLSVALAVSDDLAQDFLGRYLRAAGARVVVSDNGPSLLNSAHIALAAGLPFDAAVIDGRLYQASVVAVREALALGHAGFTIPAVLIAQRGNEGKIRRSRAGDASLTVIKPVRRTALIRAVAMAAGRLINDPGPSANRRAAEQPSLVRVVPAEPPPMAPGSAPWPSPPRPTNPRTATATPRAADGNDPPLVLVAEDNPINRRVIGMQLSTLGVAVDIVNDGQQALLALATKPYDLLLTDCHMPEMDGFELTRRVRAGEAESGPRLPIVAFTANAFEGEAERFRAAGMDDYLCKPLQLGRLAAALQRWLPPGAALPVGNPTDAPAEAPAAETRSSAAEPRSPVAEPRSSAIDLAAMAALCGDDPPLIREMLQDFVKVSRKICHDLAAAIEHRVPLNVRHCAHNLKGSSGTAGARDLAEAACRLEAASQSADWDQVVRLADAVQLAMERVAAYVEAM